MNTITKKLSRNIGTKNVGEFALTYSFNGQVFMVSFWTEEQRAEHESEYDQIAIAKAKEAMEFEIVVEKVLALGSEG